MSKAKPNKLPFPLFRNGYVRVIHLVEDNDFEGPPAGKEWLVLSGRIGHINGTASYIYMQHTTNKTNLAGNAFFVRGIGDGMGTGDFALFSGDMGVSTATLGTNIVNSGQHGGMVLTTAHDIVLKGGSGVTADIEVWEVDA